MVKAIIFDFDGVIVDSTGIKTEAFRELFSGYREVNEIVEYHNRNMGISRFVKFEHIYRNILGMEFGNGISERLGKEYQRIVMNKVIDCDFIKGAREFLGNHYKKIDLYIASGTPDTELNQIVDLKGIRRFFRCVYGSDCEKADIIDMIVIDNWYNKKDVVFVGDALHDYEEAEEAGVKFVGVVRGKDSQLQGVDCLKIKDLSQLEGVL